jgi:malate dehydrogenase (oxaloacetate-decarboxylating)(NADP+)
MLRINKQDALDYHSQEPAGKIEVVPTKPSAPSWIWPWLTRRAWPSRARQIALNPDDVYKYTAKGNLVAVISNGTAVLGWATSGPAASKPVMEGKGVLFKKFAGLDVFDIEIDATDPDEFIRIVKSLEPTFGGINLEDIKAPECFRIETSCARR